MRESLMRSVAYTYIALRTFPPCLFQLQHNARIKNILLFPNSSTYNICGVLSNTAAISFCLLSDFPERTISCSIEL